MKAVAIFLSVLNAGLALNPIPFEVRKVSNESIWTDVETRIYGGTEASEGQFPFMVFVMMKNPTSVISLCSASLIKPQWVLLAAHCVSVQGLKPRNIIVAGARAKLRDYVAVRVQNYESDINEELFGLQERRAKEFHIHPKYNDRTLEHDAALIELERPFVLGPIQTISLSKDVMKKPQFCTILGWGLTLGNLQTFKLNYAENKRVKTTKLGCAYKPSGPFICLEPDNRGICQGDSGSPLVCNNEVWGVASHFVSREENPDCGNSLEEYYTDLYENLGWINDKIGNSGFKSAVINSKSFLVCAIALLWSAM